jgi:predicted transcriptional regulator
MQDQELKDFICLAITSFEAWDVIKFFGKKEDTFEISENIFRDIGRKEEKIKPVLKDLTEKNILKEVEKNGKIYYSLFDKEKNIPLINKFLEYTRETLNRMEVVSYILNCLGE